MSGQSSINFEELSQDSDFTSKITSFHNNVDKIGNILQTACERDVYEKLSVDDRVKYDLFMSYSINSLFWLYMRTQGLDPSKHSIKSEIERVRGYNVRARQIHDRRTIMPRLDTAVAERFIRSGLWEPGQRKQVGQAEVSTPAED